MPKRKGILGTGEHYHIFNRGVEKRIIFEDAREYNHFLEVIQFYQRNHRFRFSRLRRKERQKVIANKTGELLIEILCYCLMPNHFHFLIKQVAEKGIETFLQRITNSYSHYFNIKHDRVGPLFQGKFRSIRIENTAQLIHVSRYIHINPVTAYIVKKPEDYRWSSYQEYLKMAEGFCEKGMILNQFSGIDSYQQFVNDMVDFNKNLERIKHLAID